MFKIPFEVTFSIPGICFLLWEINERVCRVSLLCNLLFPTFFILSRKFLNGKLRVSRTFSEQLFCTKEFCAAFLYFQVSISSTFYARILRRYFGAKNFVQKMRVLNVDEIDNSLTRTENFWNRKRITNAGATKEGQNRSWKSEEFFRNPETNTSRRSSCPVIFHSFFKSFETYT